MILSTLLMSAAMLDSPADVLVQNGLEISAGAVTYTTFFNADGTYTTDVGIEGTWELVGNEVCVVRSTGESGCAPVQENLSVGSSWEGTNAATGETVTYTIVPR